MNIDHPRNDQIGQLRSLWKTAFGDTEDFLDLFFQTAFSPSRCLCANRGDAVAGVLYWFDVQWAGQQFAYLYTIATAPEGNTGIGVLFSIFDENHKEIILDTKVRLVARDENQYYSQTMYKLLDYVLQGGFSILKAKELLFNLLYSVSTDQSLMQKNPRLKSIIPAIRYMEDNLQSTLSIDMLAEMCFMSKSTFHRRFLAEFQMPPTAYHLKMRIQKSQVLLQSGMYTVEQVAELMGFCDTGYFSRMFKKLTGITPGEFRKQKI